MDSWIRCRVDLCAVFCLFVCFVFCFVFVLFCFGFFSFFFSDVLDSNILCYATGFYMLLFFHQMFLTCSRARARVCVCVCVCVLFIGIVQCNWACLTWKSAIEIKSLSSSLSSYQNWCIFLSCAIATLLHLSVSFAFDRQPFKQSKKKKNHPKNPKLFFKNGTEQLQEILSCL